MMEMTLEEALEYCQKERVTITFYDSHVEIVDGWNKASEVEFLDAVIELRRLDSL